MEYEYLILVFDKYQFPLTFKAWLSIFANFQRNITLLKNLRKTVRIKTYGTQYEVDTTSNTDKTAI